MVMNAKKTMVTLTDRQGVAVSFPFQQAEKILRMPFQGGWTLTDKDFTFDNNVLDIRKDKGKADKAVAQE